MGSDRAALMCSFIDDLGAAEATLADLERRGADLRIPADERADLKIARKHVESVRVWRQRMEGDRG